MLNLRSEWRIVYRSRLNDFKRFDQRPNANMALTGTKICHPTLRCNKVDPLYHSKFKLVSHCLRFSAVNFPRLDNPLKNAKRKYTWKVRHWVQFNSVSQPWTECKNDGSGCHASKIVTCNFCHPRLAGEILWWIGSQGDAHRKMPERKYKIAIYWENMPYHSVYRI